MCPGALGEQAGKLLRLPLRAFVGQQFMDTFPHLRHGFFSLIGQDEGLVVHFRDRLSRHGLQN